ncbi:DUF7336 domain-containing protein [Nocardia pseudovaccinii]|uniref:DUF7336 domain-containing protein n=1 Tax=Nocardia pseudovaccinii TaxID=189540 RepID=UPI000A045CF0|nr:hypothetical protein [Nocardia pseudovaccinii]
MGSVFLLEHVYQNDDREEERKRIGVYESEEDARNAILRLHDQPGFRDYPENFVVQPYEVDKSYWSEGYDDTDQGR